MLVMQYYITRLKKESDRAARASSRIGRQTIKPGLRLTLAPRTGGGGGGGISTRKVTKLTGWRISLKRKVCRLPKSIRNYRHVLRS